MEERETDCIPQNIFYSRWKLMQTHLSMFHASSSCWLVLRGLRFHSFVAMNTDFRPGEPSLQLIKQQVEIFTCIQFVLFSKPQTRPAHGHSLTVFDFGQWRNMKKVCRNIRFNKVEFLYPSDSHITSLYLGFSPHVPGCIPIMNPSIQT